MEDTAYLVNHVITADDTTFTLRRLKLIGGIVKVAQSFDAISLTTRPAYLRHNKIIDVQSLFELHGHCREVALEKLSHLGSTPSFVMFTAFNLSRPFSPAILSPQRSPMAGYMIS